MGPNERMAVLKQNHFDYEQFPVIETVIMGHKRLYDVMKEKDALYMKEDFTDEDGIHAAELETEFAELNGWEAESEAAVLLQGLNIPDTMHQVQMSELTEGQKVKVLLVSTIW